MRLYYFIIFLFLSFLSDISGQMDQYTLFKGKAYKFPNARKYIPFSEDYKERPVIADISWDSIHVDHRDIEDGFPDVDRTGAFGIMFHSILSVPEASNYRFQLTSDDGSILWINDKLVLDNDYSKGWHSKTDTLGLAEGDYNIKIWFYQAYPTMQGIIFESSIVPGPVAYDVDTIDIDQDLLFDTGSFRIKNAGKSLLDSLSQEIQKYTKADIWIVGHTDDVGEERYNLTLSQQRADAIRNYMMSLGRHIGATYYTRGLGESEPKVSNDTEEGRRINRRVELLISGY